MADIFIVMYIILATSAAICVIILWFYKRAFNYWKKRGLEYLEPTIPFGNAANLCMKRCTLGEIFAQFYLQLKKKGIKHGGTYLLWRPVYIPIDPNIIKKILISDFDYFPNRGLYINQRDDPLSGHLFTMENKEWKMLRSKLPSVFTTAKMKKMFLTMQRLTEQFVNNLDASAANGIPVNIKLEAARYTTDVSSACMLGIETNTLHDENSEVLKHGRSFFDTQFSLLTNALVIVIPKHILKMFKLRVIPKEVERFFLALSKNIMDYRKRTCLNTGDLADTLIQLTKENDKERDTTSKDKYIMQPLNCYQVATQMAIFFGGGFETSSSAITFAAYELAKNPECQIKLRSEIHEILAKYNNNVTYESIMEMKYLEYVVDETLRLYPVVPIVPRECAKDYKVPGTEVTIEKGCFVMVTNVGIHRDPDYYPDPEKFDPERFSPKNKSNRPNVAYIPFGDGARICIGKRFGLLQTKLGVMAMILNFEVTLNEKTTEQFKFEADELILRKTNDVWINIRKLNS